MGVSVSILSKGLRVYIFQKAPGMILIVLGNTYYISAFYSYLVNWGTSLLSSTFQKYFIPYFHLLWDFFFFFWLEKRERTQHCQLAQERQLAFILLPLVFILPGRSGLLSSIYSAVWVPSTPNYPTGGSQGLELLENRRHNFDLRSFRGSFSCKSWETQYVVLQKMRGFFFLMTVFAEERGSRGAQRLCGALRNWASPLFISHPELSKGPR